MIFEKLAKFITIFRGSQNLSLDNLSKVHEIKQEVDDFLNNVLPIGPEVIERISYHEALAYFVDDRPSDSRIVKGAIILKAHQQGQLLIQVFLDKANELVCKSDGKPFGRQLVVRELDDELSETFGGKDLVIVE